MSYGWNQLGADIDGEAIGDQSGYSVSMSSDGLTVAIGAPGNNGQIGHVRVYKWDETTWNQLGVDIDGEVSADQSGYSLSLSSDGLTVAIGALLNDGNGSNSGHVRVYQWNGTTWNQLGVDIDGEASSDFSGISVSLSSDGLTAAIGASYNDGNGSNSGHVRVYQWNGTAWNQLGLDLDGEAVDDQSGNPVSLSSDGLTVAIGAKNNDGNGTESGHVRVYQWNGTTWNQLGVDIDGEAEGDKSGWSLSLSSDGFTVAIGAPFNDGNGEFSGHVRVYQWNTPMIGQWNQLGGDIDGEAAGDQSGSSVSLSSDGLTVAIGAPYNDGNGISAGHVCVYQWNGGAWNKLGLDIDGEMAGDLSGRSVSLSSDGLTVAIGALVNDGNGADSGHVRVYKINTENVNDGKGVVRVYERVTVLNIVSAPNAVTIFDPKYKTSFDTTLATYGIPSTYGDGVVISSTNAHIVKTDISDLSTSKITIKHMGSGDSSPQNIALSGTKTAYVLLRRKTYPSTGIRCAHSMWKFITVIEEIDNQGTRVGKAVILDNSGLSEGTINMNGYINNTITKGDTSNADMIWYSGLDDVPREFGSTGNLVGINAYLFILIEPTTQGGEYTITTIVGNSGKWKTITMKTSDESYIILCEDHENNDFNDGMIFVQGNQ